ncbi:MAG: M20/M25/M40 family metallo-hydrolase [Candidatus Aminicenantes bacterium]|nr:M20/M25/M40 family metallo-hydrolase [Candidatus Aminicenantes bacterium]
MRKYILFIPVATFIICLFVFNLNSRGEESLFSPKFVSSPLVQKIFSFIEMNEETIIKEWIYLTEMPAPSGHEETRAEYLKKEFKAAGLDRTYLDASGNVVGILKGESGGKNIILSAHMDTVFQGVWEIKVKREGNRLKAPGIGDDTANLINMLWSLRTLKQSGFKPVHTYYFLGTVGEEVALVGMRDFLERTAEDFDILLALDGDLGKVHYGALGFGGGKIIFRGPGAHTMQSRGVPSPNLAVAKALERIYALELPSQPIDKWTILNVGQIGGGRVRNAVSQESFFTVDLRSADQKELEHAQARVYRICQEVASEVGVEVEIELDDTARAYRLPGGKSSFLVQTTLDILEFLKVRDVEVNPLGSTEANAGLAKGILSLNLGRTYGRYKHSLREEAEIDGLFLALKQILLMIYSLEQKYPQAP